MWTCSSCGNEYGDKYGFCPEDGMPRTSPERANISSVSGTFKRYKPFKFLADFEPEPPPAPKERKYMTPCLQPPVSEPQSVTEPRGYGKGCLPPPAAERTTHTSNEENMGSGEAVVDRLSEEYRKLSAEEQYRATILSAKRKPTVPVDAETKANERPEEGATAASEPHQSEAQ